VLTIVGGTAAGVLDGSDPLQVDEERTVHTVHTRLESSTNPKRPVDFFFEPTGLAIERGDIVRFVSESPDYTVTAITRVRNPTADTTR